MTTLTDLSDAVARVATAVGPSIVAIGRHARGAGVVIADGQVLTNAHNLRGGEVTVTFHDGRSARGTVAGVDGDGDLAVVSVDTTGAMPIAWPDDAPTLALGSVVFGTAATTGGTLRVTMGMVSAIERAFRGPGGRRIAGSVEHTAPLAPGSSGGALVDAEGRFVGLDTNRIGEGFYLAIPADASLRERVAALARGEAPSRQRLGIAIAPAHVARRLRRSVGLADRDGVLVRVVEDGSLADGAGIEAGDLIVSAGGSPIADGDDLFDALGRLSTPFELGVVRGAEERTVTVGAAAAKGRTPGDA